MEGAIVLVVDPDETRRARAERAIAAAGLCALGFARTDFAFQFLCGRLGRVAGVIVDADAPPAGAVRGVRQMLAAWPDLKAIVTGSDALDARQAPLLTGIACTLLRTPCDAAELVDRLLGELRGEHPPRRALQRA